MKKLMLFLPIALMLLLACPLVQAAKKNRRAGGIEEFNNFKHFDRKENLIHIFSEIIFGPHLPEDPAIVKRGQIIRWGFENYEPSPEVNEEFEEEIRAYIENTLSPSTIFMIDEVAVVGWHYTDVYFFESYDHDGDGPGDGDDDGIGDVDPGYLSAFRYSTHLSVGEHTWSYESSLGTDSGTVNVLP